MKFVLCVSILHGERPSYGQGVTEFSVWTSLDKLVIRQRPGCNPNRTGRDRDRRCPVEAWLRPQGSLPQKILQIIMKSNLNICLYTKTFSTWTWSIRMIYWKVTFIAIWFFNIICYNFVFSFFWIFISPFINHCWTFTDFYWFIMRFIFCGRSALVKVDGHIVQKWPVRLKVAGLEPMIMNRSYV